MSEQALRREVIKLAHAMPSLRAALVPLVAGEMPFEVQVEKANRLDAVDPHVAKLIAISGKNDGKVGDDVVQISKKSWPAASLKPSQTSMVLPKALGMALFMLKSGKVGGDLGALVSSDGHILDGHHRWAATILASGGSGQVGGYGASLKGPALLRVLNIVSKGLFHVQSGKPGKGSLALFTPDNVRAMLTDFTENGISGDFPWSADDVKAVLEQSFGSVEAGIDQIASNADLITKKVPSWAPDRKQMPVVEPEQVPKAVKQLSRGEVDWAPPYSDQRTKLYVDERLKAALLRVAHAHPRFRSEVLPLVSVKAAALAKGYKTGSEHLASYNLDVYGNVVNAESFAKVFKYALQKSGAADFCQQTGLCRGNLGLARVEMPVLEGRYLQQFLRDLKAGKLDIDNPQGTSEWLNSGDRNKDKVNWSVKEVPASQLKATQREINADKAMGMRDSAINPDSPYYPWDPGKDPVLMSKDYYILDGHHRWAAQILRESMDGTRATLQGPMVDLPVDKLLAVTNAYTDALGIARKSF